LTLSIWGGGEGHNFLVYNLFLKKISALDAPQGDVQVFSGHQKQYNPPLGSGLP
jgi:hypothetical protein